MGDIFVAANAVTVTSAMATAGTYWQPLKDVQDISAYGRIDVQPVLLGHYGSAATPTGIDVLFYTSMQNDVDGDAWHPVGSALYLSGAAGTPQWSTFIIAYDNNQLLYRYLRWRIDLKTNTTSATFSLTGVARVL